MRKRIPNNVAAVRREKGFTQEELAERMGTTVNMLGKIERGDRKLDGAWLEKFASVLGCDQRALLAGDEMVPLPSSESLSAMLRVYLAGKLPDRIASQELVDEIIAGLSPQLIDTLRTLPGAPDAVNDPQAARNLAVGLNARRALPK